MSHPVAALAALVMLAGCVQSPETRQPAPDPDAQRLPSPSAPPADEPAETSDPTTATPTPSPLNEREARAASLRLRITGRQIYGAAAGSGFAIDNYTVITNAHVVVAGDHVAMTSWDGHDVQATVEKLAIRHDLAVLSTHERVPAEPLELADDPHEGQRVTVVGYPAGGRIIVESNVRVTDVVDGSRYADASVETGALDRIVSIDADSVQPGSSGGPVLDTSGRLVAVIFAIDTQTGAALALPVSTLRGELQ